MSERASYVAHTPNAVKPVTDTLENPGIWQRRWFRHTTVTVAVAVVAYVVLVNTLPDYYLLDVNTVLLAIPGAIALNVLTGYCGQVSIGNAAFMVIGGYTAAFVSAHVTLLPTLILGGLVAGLVGFVTGLSALRFRGLYLILATLALQFAVVFAFNAWDNASGMATAGRPVAIASLFGLQIESSQQWFVFLLVVFVLVTLFALTVVTGRTGRAMKAVRAGELNASISGVNVAWTKLWVFAVTSAVIGVQGALMGYYLGRVTFSYYTLDVAVSYIAMILLGGLGSVAGAILGAIVVILLPTIITQVGDQILGTGSVFLQDNGPALSLAIYAVLVLAVILWQPKGLVGVARSIGDGAVRAYRAWR